MSRAALAGCFVLLLTAAGGAQAQAVPAHPAPHAADDQEARDLFKLGKQAFDEGRYERALKYFKDAYDLSHRAALLSNIGTVLDRLRRDAEALEAYKSYLAQVPDAANRGLIEERVRVIEGAMQKEEQRPPAAAPASVPTPAETAQAEMARTPAPSAVDDPGRGSDSSKTSKSITSSWWFWAGIGTVAAAAVVVGVAANSGGGGTTLQGPALPEPATRVREL
jgi:tetratricopeptide (TPR) repeat protein